MALWLNWKLHAEACQMIPRIFSLMGYIQRRQGRWEESTRNLERAVELTRATRESSSRPQVVTECSGAMLNKNPS